MHFRFPSHARRGLSSLLLLAFVAVSSCFAQQFATLNLAVVDPAGSAIAQARISVRNIDTGAIRTTDSDKTGAAAIPGLPAGQYKVTVEADSFATYEAPLLLTLGQVADVQVPLHIRTATEQVEVSASTPGVERERTGGSQVIAPAQIANLPISDRDFIDFVLLTPTATIGRDVGALGRNTYRGDSYYDTDVRLQRLFSLNERIKVNLSSEFLNLLNRVNVQDVDQVYGSGELLGPLPKAYGDGVTSPANPTFGTPTFAGAARQIQLSAKLRF